MPRWAKLSERIGQDAVMAELAEANPLAALLFTWSLPAADLYGILPANVREYKARVAPALMIDGKVVEQAIAAQQAAGLIEVYDANGALLIYIYNYHKHQVVRWKRVGKPEYDLPEDWRVPETLTDWLADKKCDAKPDDYGLNQSILKRSGKLRE